MHSQLKNYLLPHLDKKRQKAILILHMVQQMSLLSNF